jgi:hypothetical protein
VKETLLKFFVFISIFVIVEFVIKLSTNSFERTKKFTLPFNNLTSSDTSIYFIGSSRVDMSLNKDILNQKFKNAEVEKLGVSASTFLGNCLIAEMVIQQQKGNKILFIELSALLDELPSSLINFSFHSKSNTIRTIFSNQFPLTLSEKVLLFCSILQKHFYYSNTLKIATIKLHEKLKKLYLKRKQPKNTKKSVSALNNNSLNTATSFLNFEDLQNPHSEPKNLNRYYALIEYLEAYAQKNNTRIIFFLPITYRKQVERQTVIPVFNSLPTKLRLDYTQMYLTEIAKSEYLFDNNHLNAEGADMNTKLLIPLIEDKIGIEATSITE